MTLDPCDVVTPSTAAKRLGIPAGTVRSWISRYRIEPLGKIGRVNVYNYIDIARIEGKRYCEAMGIQPEDSAA